MWKLHALSKITPFNREVSRSLHMRTQNRLCGDSGVRFISKPRVMFEGQEQPCKSTTKDHMLNTNSSRWKMFRSKIPLSYCSVCCRNHHLLSSWNQCFHECPFHIRICELVSILAFNFSYSTQFLISSAKQSPMSSFNLSHPNWNFF